ncbi:MAG: carotenoid oxygenase family protein [Pseudomonadota bacterium]
MNRRDFMVSTVAMAAMAAISPARAQEPFGAFGKAWRSAPDQGYPKRGMKLLSGIIPNDLSGTYFLNGPANHDRGGERNEHWFDGDGMIHAFRFGRGTPTHEGRFIETSKRKAEIEAGRFLYPVFDTMPKNPAPVMSSNDVNAANISVVERGGELWALWEGGSPTAINPNDLSTKGVVPISNDLVCTPFSAHPRIDRSGTMWGYGFDSFGGRAILSEIAPDGSLRRFNLIRNLPRSMVHDFISTEKHLILGCAPFWLTQFEPMPWLDRFRWQPNEARVYVVIDKETLTEVRRYETPAAFQFHHFDGFEEKDGTIRFAACSYPDASWVQTEARAVMDGVPYTGTREAHFERITLRPDGRVDVEADGQSAEFPVGDPRFVNTPTMQWNVGRARDEGRLNHSLIARKPDGEIAVQWNGPDDTFLGEHVAIPRANGGGYLIGVQFDTTLGRSLLSLFDGQNVGRGPLALWQLPDSIPAALHGTWVASA